MYRTTHQRTDDARMAGRPSLLDTGPVPKVPSHTEWPPAPPTRHETAADAGRRRQLESRAAQAGS